MRKLLLTLAGEALLSSPGCGLDDYEKRMDIERKRMRLFDAEEANLGGWIEAPDAPAWPFQVFLRVPFGFNELRHKEQYKQGDLFLYRYVCNVDKPNQEKPNETIKPGWNMFVACSKVGEIIKAKELFKPGELSHEAFQGEILKVLREYYRSEYRKYDGDYQFVYKKPEKIELVIERVKEPNLTIAYETLDYVAPGNGKEIPAYQFQFYFHKNGGNQIAIVFQLPKALTEEAKFVRSRDYCLKSLDISEDAMKKKMEFRARRTKKTPLAA